MAKEYSVDLCNRLAGQFAALGLHRPMRVGHYDAGTELEYEVRGFTEHALSRIRLKVERFVGGGFAGQVYQVRLLNIESQTESLQGLHVGGLYAMKILIPPSAFSRLFRNALYAVGFQGPFQLQVNPAAARAGALWQRFIQRAAAIRFGDETVVVGIYGTFVDSTLGSCGEISEWVEGRTWQLEVDSRLDLLRRWRRGQCVDESQLGSPEYRAKKQFMGDFVALLHDTGAHEFARQYEWSTCKSQPNCLKRTDRNGGPADGLTAVDFRAGLALLPFLPMSPGDIPLILKGLARGSLVQFDRGNLAALERFVARNGDRFADMRGMLEELKQAEDIYRNSVPDITHNHIRLLYSRKLYRTMFDSAVTGWKVRGLVADKAQAWLRHCKASTFLFFLVGLIPVVGRVLRKTWGRPDWRRHYCSVLTSRLYFQRALRGRALERIIAWHRKGRVSAEAADRMAQSLPRYFLHMPFSLLPAGLDRFITDGQFRKEKLAYIFVRPMRLYFNADLRRRWMLDMIADGRRKHILSEDDAQTILAQLDEPYIQKYLISLVVHLMTLPVTQVVSLTVAIIYVVVHKLPWDEALTTGAAILIAFQVVPISPGSFCRGFYTTAVAIRDRSFKDYNIALFLSYFKYVGYLAFPIQMTYRYPAMARFMAAHWATDAVHVVPVFGEKGALLEHWVFCLFYNWPLTLRRRMRKRAEARSLLRPRYWHAGVCVAALAALLGWADQRHFASSGALPLIGRAMAEDDFGIGHFWWFIVLAPLLNGALITLGARGASLGRRVLLGVASGIALGLLYTLATTLVARGDGLPIPKMAFEAVWRAFIFAVVSTIGLMLTELWLPEPAEARGRF